MKAAENRENIERQLISRLTQGDPAAVVELVARIDSFPSQNDRLGIVGVDANECLATAKEC